MKKEAMLYEKLDKNHVLCLLCSHNCKIEDSRYGFCGVRKNEKGTLYTHVYGKAIASHVDPIEKKPLYHFLPGSQAYSIATVGCNFQCEFCQNWQISQASKKDGDFDGYELKPEEVVRKAKKYNCRSISYTYTEPTIFFEYAYDTSKIAKKEALYNTFVTNGYMTKEALDTIKPYLDACNVDLKSFSDETYKRMCKGTLAPVLESIRHMKKIGMWVEVTTLVVPGMNDSDRELKSIAEFIAGVGKDIPWHISRFHPDYKLLDAMPTPLETLDKAASIGAKAGLRYIYLGNIAREGNTRCHKCGELLIERVGYTITQNKIKNKKCPSCGTVAAGVW
ncbi:MAG: AmmeMemoRadiSam system radical SAM enzyme [Candidatus Omnitrophica bacterium]|nr:AmmeMemoRadiSam system radical SAM enzyme [Candidatus Omnitrophota bacterium]